MVYRNNTGRLVPDFISVCLETRWLGQKLLFLSPGTLLYGLNPIFSKKKCFLNYFPLCSAKNKYLARSHISPPIISIRTDRG